MGEEDLTYDLYRCSTSSGSKDWAIAVTRGSDLRILHCATDRPVRRIDIPRKTFSDVNEEYSRRVREKTVGGYQRVGNARLDRKNRIELNVGTAPATLAAHWEIVIPLERTALLERMAWAAGQLSSLALPDPILWDERTGMVSTCGPKPWSLGYADDGGLSSDGRGGGVILNDQGFLPRLILVYLQRQYSDAVRIALADGTLLQPLVAREDRFLGIACGFDYERVLQLGAALRLCIGRVRLLDSNSASDQQAIWI